MVKELPQVASEIIPELKAFEVSSYEDGDCIAEEIAKFDGCKAVVGFAVWDGHSVKYCRVLPGPEENSCYAPICDDAVVKKAVKLPSAATDYGTEAQLLEEVRAHIHKYIDISPWFEEVAANYILLTWIYDVLPTVPYLRALGDTGTGKSRFLNVVGGLCYKPIFANGAITPAPIYRMLKAWPGTLIIDEGDWKESDEYQEIVKILNSGFEKDRPVLRCVKDNPDKVQVLNVYGPKIIGTRRAFFDQALESRCLTETMSMTNRKDMPVLLLDDFDGEQLGLRNKLLMFRFKMRPRIKIDLSIAEKLGADIEPRLKQATISFTVLFANMPELFERFRTYLVGYQKELIENRSSTYEGMVVKALFLLAIEQKNDAVTSSSISTLVKDEFDVDLKPHSVGKILKVLKIDVSKPRNIDGKTMRIVLTSKPDIISLARRYVPDIENYSNYKYYSTYGYCQNNNGILSYGEKKDEKEQGVTVSAVIPVIPVINKPEIPISKDFNHFVSLALDLNSQYPEGFEDKVLEAAALKFGFTKDYIQKAIGQLLDSNKFYMPAPGRLMKA